MIGEMGIWEKGVGKVRNVIRDQRNGMGKNDWEGHMGVDRNMWI